MNGNGKSTIAKDDQNGRMAESPYNDTQMKWAEIYMEKNGMSTFSSAKGTKNEW